MINNIEGIPFVTVDKTFTFCSSLNVRQCGVNKLVGTGILMASPSFNGLLMMNTISLKTLPVVAIVMYCTSIGTPP